MRNKKVNKKKKRKIKKKLNTFKKLDIKLIILRPN